MQLFLLVVAAALTAEGPGPDTVRFKAKEVLVSDSDGVPLFRGKRDFVLRIARNPTGQVVAYDASSSRVRVSKVGTELWLQCAELEPMAASCAEGGSRRSRAGSIRGGDDPAPPNVESSGIRVPSCPGDPRCPEVGD